MSTIGTTARSVCNPPHQAIARLTAARERSAIYYVALYSEMERCRVAQEPMVIGERSIPMAPTTALPYGVGEVHQHTEAPSHADGESK